MSEKTPRELAELADSSDQERSARIEEERPNPVMPVVASDGDGNGTGSGDASEGGDSEGGDGPATMTVFEHLDELRTRLFRCVGYVVAGFLVALFLSKHVMTFLQKPAGNITFQYLSFEEPVMVYLKVAFYTGIVLASPLVLFEISRFIGPGLTRKERQVVTPALIGGPFLFVAGALFAYYCLLPPMLHFFTTFGAGVTPINQRLDAYISLVSTVILYMGLCFQLPIVLFALSFTGLVSSRQLMKIWRYAVFGSSVVALIITPDPTAFSMILVMGALVGLYAITVLLLRLFGK